MSRLRARSGQHRRLPLELVAVFAAEHQLHSQKQLVIFVLTTTSLHRDENIIQAKDTNVLEAS